MKKQYHITIGISAYNEEANVKNLLKAILQQKNESFLIDKIIVMSDGSNDTTVKKAKGVKDKRIQVIDNKDRKGQNARQNEIIDMTPKTSDFLLFFEADTLPDNSYIEQLVARIPEDERFSVIVGDSLPIAPVNLFERIVVVGYWFRKDLFEHADDETNLYLCGHNGLLSRSFLKHFRWNPNFHEDSYLFRKAKSSVLPFIRAKRAKLYYKSVTNLTDYIIQSSKYQKAREKEREHSNIYSLHIKKRTAVAIFIKHFFAHPLLFSSYILCQRLAVISSLFAPEYSPFWKTYLSSKIVFLS